MNAYPHRIRLRGPWECEPQVSPPRRVTLPGRWGEGDLAGLAGRVCLRRRFGYPGRIDAYERVWLTCAGLPGPAEVRLNSEQLGRQEATFDLEVTNLLRPRNELTLDMEAPADGGLVGEVALEVRRTAFLRALRAWLEGGRLHVAGEVAGTSERPLELYALLERRTVVYATVEAAPRGRPFHLASEPLASEGPDVMPASIRVDLIDGAVVWYATEVALAPR